MRSHFPVVGSDVGTLAAGIEQITIGFAIGADAIADPGASLEHAHRIASRRDLVDLNVVLGGFEILLFDLVRQAAFSRNGKACRNLHGASARVEELRRIGTGKDATRRNHRNIKLLSPQIGENFGHDGGQIVLRPIHAKTQVAASQRPLDNDEIRQTVGPLVLLQEQLQGTHRRDDDAEFGIAKPGMVLDQGERTQVQAGGQGNPLDTGIECCSQTHLQGFLGGVHGQLFHAIDEDQATAGLACHGRLDVQAGRLFQSAEIELDRRLVLVIDVVLVERELFLDVLGVVAAVGDGIDHRIGNMANPAQTGGFQRQIGGGNIHPHAADHDRNQLMFAQSQAKIIHTLHCCP